MPQIVKGGKYVFGWSKVGEKGKITIPHEALQEYNLGTHGILMPGSMRSGGFGLTTLELLRGSHLSAILDKNPQLARFEIPEGEPVEIDGKWYCWVRIRNGTITVPLEMLAHYQIHPGDMLLSVRGSGIALGFPVKGPIIEEAKTHKEIELFE